MVSFFEYLVCFLKCYSCFMMFKLVNNVVGVVIKILFLIVCWYILFWYLSVLIKVDFIGINMIIILGELILGSLL